MIARVVALLALSLPHVAAAVCLAVGPDDAPEVLLRRYEGLAAHIAREAQRPCELRVASSYEELQRDFARGAVDIAIVSPLNYISLRAQAENASLVARLEKYGISKYGVVVFANGAVDKLGDLVGRRFVHFSSNSTSGYLYPLAALAAAGVDIDKVRASSEQIAGSHFDVIERVATTPRSFAATSTDKWAEARVRNLPLGRLNVLLRTPEEIPFDAVVVNGQLPRERHREYVDAIGELVLHASRTREDVFPAVTGITGVRAASEDDYDPIRRTRAAVGGGGVFRIGLSENLQPATPEARRAALQPIREWLFARHRAWLDVKVYGRDEFDVAIGDLENNTLDIAEFPPVPAGRAMQRGLIPILSPLYDDSTFPCVVVRRRDRSDLSSALSLRAARFAVLKPSSASSYAFPLHLLNAKGVDVSKLTLVHRTEPFEIVNAVVAGQADAGALAAFQLAELKAHGPDMQAAVEALELIPELTQHVPNGAYVVNRVLSGKDAAPREQLKSLLAATASAVATRPSFGAMRPQDTEVMSAVYSYHHPVSHRMAWLLAIAGVLTIGAGCVFFLTDWRSANSHADAEINEPPDPDDDQLRRAG